MMHKKLPLHVNAQRSKFKIGCISLLNSKLCVEPQRRKTDADQRFALVYYWHHMTISTHFTLLLNPGFIPFSRSSKSLTCIPSFQQLFSTLPRWNTSTSNLTITNPTLILMEQCSSMSQLKQIHAHMMRTGLFFHVFPVSRIIAFCALSDKGDISYAHLVFDQISNPNVYIWNTMIRGYCKALNPVMGISCFREMIREGVEMDERSFLFAMKGFDQVSGFREGGLVHCQIRKLGFSSSVLVQNGLISFYADGGSLSCARQVFDESSSRDVVTWTAMIDGNVQRNAPDEALRVFDLMVRSEVRPNEVTMIALLSACTVKGDLNLGRRIHSYIEKLDLQCTLNLMNAMLDMYVKCGCLKTAKCIFDKMDNRDVFSWTSMVNGYAKHGELELARKYFGEIPVKNVISWNAMISGYSQNNQPKEALDLFHDMLEGGIAPIEATLVCVLSACAQAGCFSLGQWIHNHYLHQKRVEFTVSLGNALIGMYAKCGRIDVAEELFGDMSQRDLVSWNSMIVGHADHGSAKKALNLFEEMKDEAIKPDDITFVGVLSACSHAGLVTRGRELFGEMEQIFGLKPKIEHYVCMIDLLGRVGLVEEAYDMIKGMPMEPDEAAWGALLNACRMHGNADLGKHAADMLIDLDPEDSGTYVILANLCARERRWGDVSQVRNMMREKGIRKTPGRSCIEMDGKFFEFLASDDSHPQSEDVYRILDEIFALSKLEEDLACALKSINYFENVNTLLVNG